MSRLISVAEARALGMNVAGMRDSSRVMVDDDAISHAPAPTSVVHVHVGSAHGDITREATQVRGGGFGAPPAPAAKKTVKHKLVKHHEEETTIVDDDPDDDDDDDDDDKDPDEEDEDEARAVDTAPVRAALAAKGRVDAARSEDRRIRSLRAQRSLEQQSEAERHAARVIAATAGHTGEPRFASLEDIDKQRAASRNRGGRIIDGKYVVGA